MHNRTFFGKYVNIIMRTHTNAKYIIIISLLFTNSRVPRCKPPSSQHTNYVRKNHCFKVIVATIYSSLSLLPFRNLNLVQTYPSHFSHERLLQPNWRRDFPRTPDTLEIFVHLKIKSGVVIGQKEKKKKTVK